MKNLIENTDKELFELNSFLRSKVKKESPPTVLIKITPEQLTETMISNADPDFKKSVISDVLINM